MERQHEVENHGGHEWTKAVPEVPAAVGRSVRLMSWRKMRMRT
jgi:hypothetical protein